MRQHDAAFLNAKVRRFIAPEICNTYCAGEIRMNRGKIIFTGNFFEFFLFSLGLMVLSIVTLGIALPYVVYWQFKYFFTHMEIEFYNTGVAVNTASYARHEGN
jgi:hypothetical protein